MDAAEPRMDSRTGRTGGTGGNGQPNPNSPVSPSPTLPPSPLSPSSPPATSRPFSALTRAISLTPTRGASSGGLTRGASSGALSRGASGSLAPTRAQLSALRRAAAFQQQHPSCWPSRGRMQATTDSFDFNELGLTDVDWMGDDGDSPASAKSPGEAVDDATSSPSNRTAPSDRNDEPCRGAETVTACPPHQP
ncbi:unnamed protein product [Closterium sp. Yama58-4]|nr:unnamed protein product [Closterium sp. Yama58-4]